MARRWLAALVGSVLIVGVSTFALRYFSPSLFSSGKPSASAVQRYEMNRDRAAAVDQILSHAQPSRPVYPYSVVPGGVEDVQELKWVAEHDPIVGAHYAGFNYARAQVVRLTLARTVYVSYRIGNRIYWTRRRVTLRKGEKLITDGKMTARTRCANRVEETPQQQQAEATEPTPEKLDRPIGAGQGTAMQAPPAAFQSALLNRPQIPGLEPTGPLSAYDPLVGGNPISLLPPPLPSGLCGPKKKKGANEIEVEADSTGKNKKRDPCGNGGSPAPVPEPGTWLLLGSGLAILYWQARHRLIRS